MALMWLVWFGGALVVVPDVSSAVSLLRNSGLESLPSWAFAGCADGLDVGFVVVLSDPGAGGSEWDITTSIIAPLLSSNSRIVLRGTSLRVTIMPATVTKRIGWFLWK